MNTSVTQPQTKRLLWIDVLNIMACVGVVALHSTRGRFTGELSLPWLWTEFIYVAISWPVPVFFMISGCNLLSCSTGGVYTYAIKRIKKTLWPFLVWSFLYLLFNIFVQEQTYTCKEVIEAFLMGQLNPNMWFFLPLFSLYFIFPLLWDFCSLLSSRKLLYLIGVVLMFAFVIPYCFLLLRLNTLAKEWYLNFSYMSGYICLAITGWWIGHNDIPKKWRNVLYAIALFLVVITFVVIIHTTLLGQKIAISRSPVKFVLPIAIFTFIKYIDWEQILCKLNINVRTITQLAALSYGVYLIHNAVLVVAEMFHLHFYNVYVGFIPTYITSVSIAYIIKRTPIVKHILP